MTDENREIKCLSPFSIRPIHDVREERRFTELRKSMKRHGWEGRPLLVVKDHQKTYAFQALTGSHRLAAAQGTLRSVPAIVVPPEVTNIVKASRYYPAFPPGLTQDLFEHGEGWLGRYIRLDGWLEGLPQKPWSEEGLEWLRELGHEDMVEIMSVRDWGCAPVREGRSR